jgi:hypothetical protein
MTEWQKLSGTCILTNLAVLCNSVAKTFVWVLLVIAQNSDVSGLTAAGTNPVHCSAVAFSLSLSLSLLQRVRVLAAVTGLSLYALDS